MSNVNSVTLIGNLTQDPELKFTASGVAMLKISFAVNKRYQSQGEWKEDTSFFNGTMWRDLAENAAESLTKGMRVIVVGELGQRSWETESGDKRSMVEIEIKEIGPSVRWATAVVTRTPRQGEGGSGGAPAPAKDDFAPEPAGGDSAPF